MRKFSYEEMKKYIEDADHILLSEKCDYKNTKSYIIIKCPYGHEFTTTFKRFKSGKRCFSCFGNKKYTFGEVKKYIEEEDHALLSSEYENNRTKLEIQCPKGHVFNSSFKNFKNGKRRCPTCGGTEKHKYEEVKEYIENQDYILLDTEYINASTKMTLQCPSGHKFSITFAKFQNGGRCPICRGNKKFTYEQVEEFIKNEGYKLLSSNYTGIHEKLKIKCPEEHVFDMSFNHFKWGNRCPYCSGTRKFSNEEIIKALQLYEDIRKNKNNEIEVTCKNCGKWFIPERKDLTYKIQYINGEIRQGTPFYCSDKCKEICPMYNQRYYPKYYKPYLDREVQPELAKMVLKRDEYTCIICQRHQSEVELHCHHIEGVNWNPLESADIDNCTTLCKDCHKKVHSKKGCTYKDMQCSHKT